MTRASLEQQRDIIRYMGELNNWLGRDVHDRQEEIRTILAQIDDMRRELTGRPPMTTGKLIQVKLTVISHKNIGYIPGPVGRPAFVPAPGQEPIAIPPGPPVPWQYPPTQGPAVIPDDRRPMGDGYVPSSSSSSYTEDPVIPRPTPFPQSPGLPLQTTYITPGGIIQQQPPPIVDDPDRFVPSSVSESDSPYSPSFSTQPPVPIPPPGSQPTININVPPPNDHIPASPVPSIYVQPPSLQAPQHAPTPSLRIANPTVPRDESDRRSPSPPIYGHGVPDHPGHPGSGRPPGPQSDHYVPAVPPEHPTIVIPPQQVPIGQVYPPHPPEVIIRPSRSRSSERSRRSGSRRSDSRRSGSRRSGSRRPGSRHTSRSRTPSRRYGPGPVVYPPGSIPPAIIPPPQMQQPYQPILIPSQQPYPVQSHIRRSSSPRSRTSRSRSRASRSRTPRSRTRSRSSRSRSRPRSRPRRSRSRTPRSHTPGTIVVPPGIPQVPVPYLPTGYAHINPTSGRSSSRPSRRVRRASRTPSSSRYGSRRDRDSSRRRRRRRDRRRSRPTERSDDR
jgi:hypothetical protein